MVKGGYSLRKLTGITRIGRYNKTLRRIPVPDDKEEKEKGKKRDIRANRRVKVSKGIKVRIIRVTAGYPRKSQKVLRKKGKINTKKHKDKLRLKIIIIHRKSEHKRESVDNPRENCKDCPHREYIMKMCHHIIGIMQHNINRRIRKEHPRQPP